MDVYGFAGELFTLIIVIFFLFIILNILGLTFTITSLATKNGFGKVTAIVLGALNLLFGIFMMLTSDGDPAVIIIGLLVFLNGGAGITFGILAIKKVNRQAELQ